MNNVRYGYVNGLDKGTRDEAATSLRAFGVDHIIIETKLLPPKKDSELSKLISAVSKGDEIIVENMEHMGCSTFDLVKIMNALETKRCAFVSLKEQMNTKTSQGKAMLQMLRTISKIEQKQLSKRISWGIRTSEKKGTKLGRPRISKEWLSLAIQMYDSGHFNIREIVAISKVSQGTIYKEVNRLKFLKIDEQE
ncbi:recombinase family protein [Enterococcus sp. DIV0840c]|uniref:recombinase family protein n=1 Tax=Enterococcus sp. DIV0840c TaxID=2774772 RepID=UPI003D2AD56A